jgi:hypothetical protein
MSLGQPFTSSWKSLVMPLMKYSVILPAGEYRPAFEDDKFYSGALAGRLQGSE